MKISIQISDQGEEGKALGSLGNSYQSLGDYQKSIEYHEKDLEIAIEISDRGGEGVGYMEILVLLTCCRVTIENPLSTMRNI